MRCAVLEPRKTANVVKLTLRIYLGEAQADRQMKESSHNYFVPMAKGKNARKEKKKPKKDAKK